MASSSDLRPAPASRDTGRLSRTFEGFEKFVVARWPALENVAVVVALDAAAARRDTRAALATLHHQWRETATSGCRPHA